jgi:hypothetical protein
MRFERAISSVPFLAPGDGGKRNRGQSTLYPAITYIRLLPADRAAVFRHFAKRQSDNRVRVPFRLISYVTVR